MTPRTPLDRPADGEVSVAVVGAGPRGVSVLERLAAHLESAGSAQAAGSAGSAGPGTRLVVHLIDPAEPGAGEVWRTDQPDILCMNTLADAVTLFTEPGASVTAPVHEGPTLHAWARARGLTGTGSDAAPDAEPEVTASAAEPEVAAPAAAPSARLDGPSALHPWSHPPRALYGRYLRWCLDRAVDRLAALGVDVRVHRSRAVALHADAPATGTDAPATDTATTDTLLLADGTSVTAHATVLAQGWTPVEPDAMERFLAVTVDSAAQMSAAIGRPSPLTWVRPGTPVDQDLSSLAAGAEVIVRGLGMGFTDAVTLLTVGRGGRFVRDAAARSGLRYVPSGREPRIVASSHRGYPFLPKPEFGAMPPTPSMPRLTALLDRFGPGGPDTEPGSLDATDPGTGVWPAVVRDAHEEFLRTLLTSTVGTPGPLLDRARAVIDAARDPESLHRDPGIRAVIAEAVGGPAAGGSGSGDDAALPCLDIPALMDPVGAYRPGDGAAGGAGADPGADPVADFTAWVGDRLVDDLREAAAGRDSALRAGLRVIGAARTPVHLIGQAGRYTAASRPAVARLTAFGQMVGSGPPAFRTRELLALVDAGVVRFAGAHPTVVVDPEAPAFVLTSPTTGDHPVAAPALLDAWMHAPDVRSSADPLTAALVAAGRVRPFTPGADGRPTRSPDVDLPSTRVIGADGTPDPRVHLVGIPLQELRAGTTVSPVPGTDPLMLRETDAAAGSALRAALGAELSAHPGAEPGAAGDGGPADGGAGA
ncbi:FAD/NAD(P)-binding protein [Corynebacterium bovis]|uniref:FAD/NAD(P)-binding protein n=1 Tax=Corynebacterium bovis TaxID=36808 RepID=UPI00254DBA03|nr:FAD/NAD(P)-binding protein [Corynebacterium bovis]MDK8511541.1 FAD/NAD(P)-binding protein [Corynebacterium bovis]